MRAFLGCLLTAAAVGLVYFGTVAERGVAGSVDPGSDRPAATRGDAPTPQSHEVRVQAPTEGGVAALGAAAWVPERVAFFKSFLGVREQWQRFRASKAAQRLLALPSVQMGLLQLSQNPVFQALHTTPAGTHPVAAMALDVMRDGLSHEVFIYGGEAFVPFVESLQAVRIELVKSALASPRNARRSPPPPELFDAILAHADTLRMPPLVVGFKLSDPDKAQALMEFLAQGLANQSPLPFARGEMGGARYLSLRLEGRMIPRGQRSQIMGSLTEAGLPLEKVLEFVRFIDSQTVVAALALRGDYLLLTVGSNLDHLEALGTPRSLARSAPFAPVRKRLGGATPVGVGFVDEAWSFPRIDEGSAISGLRKFFQSAPAGSIPPGLESRLLVDAGKFITELNTFIPDPRPFTSVKFLNQGYESFVFTGTSPTPSKPMKLLAHTGESPLAWFASRDRSSQAAYEFATRWIQTAYGYFEEFVVPRMSLPERTSFEEFRTVFLPTLKSLHDTTRTELLPSLHGAESLFVLDGLGATTSIPGLEGTPWEHLPRPLRFPRPALVMELREPDRFLAALSHYRETLNRFLETVSRFEPELTGLSLPEPQRTEREDGALYTYSIPSRNDPRIEIHALLRDDIFVVSFHPQQAASLLERRPVPPDGVVSVGSSAHEVHRVDLARLFEIVFANADVVLEQLVANGEITPSAYSLIKAHLPVLEDVCRCLKGIEMRGFEEDGGFVRHRWTHIQDLE